MNFQDELNEICRTPDEVATVKSNKEYKKVKNQPILHITA